MSNKCCKSRKKVSRVKSIGDILEVDQWEAGLDRKMVRDG